MSTNIENTVQIDDQTASSCYWMVSSAAMAYHAQNREDLSPAARLGASADLARKFMLLWRLMNEKGVSDEGMEEFVSRGASKTGCDIGDMLPAGKSLANARDDMMSILDELADRNTL